MWKRWSQKLPKCLHHHLIRIILCFTLSWRKWSWQRTSLLLMFCSNSTLCQCLITYFMLSYSESRWEILRINKQSCRYKWILKTLCRHWRNMANNFGLCWNCIFYGYSVNIFDKISCRMYSMGNDTDLFIGLRSHRNSCFFTI